jgi:hypothetical protein
MIKTIYNKILRPHLGYKYGELNGVKTKAFRTLDQTEKLPDYNDILIKLINDLVSDSMSVCICGDLYGVQTVCAAKAVGSAGSVVVYEGSARNTWRIRDACSKNNLDAEIKVNHAIVGKISNLYDAEESILGSQFGILSANKPVKSNPEKIEPNNLPETDVMILNTSGNEIYVIDRMENEPKYLIIKSYEQALPGFTAALESILSGSYETELYDEKWLVAKRNNKN